MNFRERIGRLFGRTKEKKSDAVLEDGTVLEEHNQQWSEYQEFSCLKDPFDQHLNIRRREHDLHPFRTSNSNVLNNNNELPSANEIRKTLLEADRAHKLWKIRHRLKRLGLEPSKELLSIELDQRGSQKWDHIINRPVVERYIYMVQYIRNLAAKEARLSGHDAAITSETSDNNLTKVHKKFRLDFSLNSKGEPSNMSVGEDSSDYSVSDEEETGKIFNDESSFWKYVQMSKKERRDMKEMSLTSLYEIHDNRKYETPIPSVNILKELNRVDISSSEESFNLTIPTTDSKICNSSSSTERIIPCVEVTDLSGSYKSSTVKSFEESESEEYKDSDDDGDVINLHRMPTKRSNGQIFDISKHYSRFLRNSSPEESFEELKLKI